MKAGEERVNIRQPPPSHCIVGVVETFTIFKMGVLLILAYGRDLYTRKAPLR